MLRLCFAQLPYLKTTIFSTKLNLGEMAHVILARAVIHNRRFGCAMSERCLAEKGKTNNWLADQLNMNRTTVSKWCRNEMQPRVETLFQIAKVVEVDVRELLVSTN
jgi:putative transcriptional regulator